LRRWGLLAAQNLIGQQADELGTPGKTSLKSPIRFVSACAKVLQVGRQCPLFSKSTTGNKEDMGAPGRKGARNLFSNPQERFLGL